MVSRSQEAATQRQPIQQGWGRNPELSHERNPPVRSPIPQEQHRHLPSDHLVKVARQDTWALLSTLKSLTSEKCFSIMFKAVRATWGFSWSCKASILSMPPISSIRRHRFSFSASFSAACGRIRKSAETRGQSPLEVTLHHCGVRPKVPGFQNGSHSFIFP